MPFRSVYPEAVAPAAGSPAWLACRVGFESRRRTQVFAFGHRTAWLSRQPHTHMHSVLAAAAAVYAYSRSTRLSRRRFASLRFRFRWLVASRVTRLLYATYERRSHEIGTPYTVRYVRPHQRSNRLPPRLRAESDWSRGDCRRSRPVGLARARSRPSCHEAARSRV